MDVVVVVVVIEMVDRSEKKRDYRTTVGRQWWLHR
jgi:hypothetical protein